MNKGVFPARWYYAMLTPERIHELTRDADIFHHVLCDMLAYGEEEAFFLLLSRKADFSDYHGLMVILARSDVISAERFAWFIDYFHPDLDDGSFHMGQSVLWWCNSAAKIAVAIERGADVHHMCWHGKQAVRYHARYNHMDLVDMLLQYGAWIGAARHGIKKWHRIWSNRDAFPELEGKLAHIDGYRVRQSRCRVTLITLLGLLRRLRVCRDVRALLARSVWRTRRRSDWEEEKNTK